MATEEPAHTVSLQDGSFEVREYPALVAAEVSVSGNRDEAASAGFRLLAGYIFGGNTRRQSIAMTAPVVQSQQASQTEGRGESIAMTAPVIQTENAGAWTVRFIMPSSYRIDTLPTPNDARVKLIALPPSRYAVIKFSGLAKADDIEKQTAELQRFIVKHKLSPIGPASLARYNPPWTLWFMRRNEIMLPLETAAAH